MAICEQILRVYESTTQGRGVQGNANAGGGARAAAEGPNTNEVRACEQNPLSSKGKEVVGRASSAAETPDTNEGRALEQNLSSSKGKEAVGSASAGGRTGGAAAAETLVLLQM